MAIRLTDQIRAVKLSSRCVSLLDTEAVWSGRLDDEAPLPSLWDRVHLSRLGYQMAADLAAIHGEIGLVQTLLHDFRAVAKSNPELLARNLQAAEVQRDHDSIIHGTHLALEHLEHTGHQEVRDLREKARLLGGVEGEGESVEGALSRLMWGAVATIGGFLIVAASVLVAVLGGQIGAAGAAAALVVGGKLLDKGLDVVLEQ
ncbi:hypothetical protein VR41_04045 [Streptomyces sp. NRRL B-1568]|nr:hypothetical protein VR41_04045 [Streptomyces sp. NRRL B-1568]